MPEQVAGQVQATVGQRIREARLRRGLSQAQLAEKLDCTQTSVSHWESGHRTIGVDDVVTVASALGVPTADLMPARHGDQVTEQPKTLGPSDEPQRSGAVVAVNYGDYRSQECWIRSGANIGNWYCLGGEFGRPEPWDDPRTEMEKMLHRRDVPAPARGPSEIVRHPTWRDVLARGPVTLLSAGERDTYAAGWANGRRRMIEQMEELGDDD